MTFIVVCVQVTLPVRVMANLGVQVLIVTNAAGSLNENYDVGDIMVIKDHINLPSLAGNNPLVGLHDPRFGARFVALTDAYDRELRRMVHDAGRELNMDYLREGIYTIQVGPLYETQAECRMLRLLGSDAVGTYASDLLPDPPTLTLPMRNCLTC